ncbi:MAG: glycosyltransferase family 39 protein [bacterium]
MKKNLSLIIIILIALIIRIYRAEESFDGFHGHNEAWYTIIADNYTFRTLLYPRSYLGTVDYNVPPLFSYVLFIIFRIFGTSEFTARSVPIFFSIVLIWLVFALGKRIYGVQAALAAALLVAVMPAAVIVGRNVQGDTMYTTLVVAFLYFYMRARESERSFSDIGSQSEMHDAKDEKQGLKTASASQHAALAENRTLYFILAGFMLGAALLTKQPAVLSIGIVIFWELTARRSLRFFNRGFALMCAIALAITMSFYLPHLILHTQEFITTQRGIFIEAKGIGGHTMAGMLSAAVIKELASEVLWGLSPPIAMLALVAIPVSFILPKRDPMPVIALSFFGLFYLFVHKHVYYMLPAAVFATLVTGCLWSGERSTPIRKTILAAVVILTAFVSLLLLCKVKYGRHEFQHFGERLADNGIRNVDVVTSDVILSSYGPLIQYYAPGSRIHAFSRLPLNSDGTAKLSYNSGFVLLFDASYAHNLPENILMASGIDLMGIVLFGYVIHPRSSPHEPFAQTFAPGGFVVKKVGPLTDFGIRRVKTRTSFKFAYLPSNRRLKEVNGVFQIVSMQAMAN